jgi:hypothetical protein
LLVMMPKLTMKCVALWQNCADVVLV